MKFIVRTNCEYSMAVDATSAEEALKKAEKVDVKEWGQAWAPMEAERDA